MKTFDAEWKLFKCLLENRHKERFRYLLNRNHDLPLSDFVNEVNMVDPFFLIQIPLMHSIYAQKPGFSLGIRLSPFPDRNRRWLGFGEEFCPGKILSRSPKVVDMGYGYGFQTLKSRIFKNIMHSFKDSSGCLSGQAIVGFVGFYERCHIFRSICFGKPMTFG